MASAERWPVRPQRWLCGRLTGHSAAVFVWRRTRDRRPEQGRLTGWGWFLERHHPGVMHGLVERCRGSGAGNSGHSAPSADCPVSPSVRRCCGRRVPLSRGFITGWVLAGGRDAGRRRRVYRAANAVSSTAAIWSTSRASVGVGHTAEMPSRSIAHIAEVRRGGIYPLRERPYGGEGEQRLVTGDGSPW